MPKFKREEEFQKWFTGPEALRISNMDYSKDLGGTNAMLEDLMRSAFEAGFQSCLTEVRSKLRGLGTNTSK